jgi:TP901 family phage tail tape measure protein
VAERKISTRLVLEGEKEYKASITNINRELKTLESALKLTESSFKGQANTVQALEAKNKALNDVIAKTAEKLNAENTALDKAKAAKSGYAEAAQKAREQLDNLKKTTDDATKETEEYAKQVAVIQAEINKYEKAEASAAVAVENHTQKANRAQTQINDLNGTLADNEKHLDEARRSTDGTAKSIDEFGKKTKEAGKEAEEFGEKSSEAVDALASALAAAGVVASIKAIADALKESVDASIEFESAMAGVAKTTDLTSDELAAMGEQIKDLTLTIPITASEFAQIVEVAGQLGVEKNNLIDFSTTMANLGVATNMTADEAATMIAQFASITGMDASGYSRLGAAIVALGNNFATNEKKITDMSQAIAGAATNAGMSEPDMLALSAAVSSLGIEAQAGGTSMSSLISKIQAAVETGDGLNEWAAAAGLSASEFAALWGTDATAALGAFIGNLNNLDASANVTLGTLGITETRMVRMITSLANAESASGLLTNAINTSNSAWQENTALVTEASTRYKTTESQITLYKNSVQNLKIAVGDELTPALQDLAKTGKEINEWATDFIETHEGIVPVITAVVVALGTFVGGLTLLAVGIPIVTKAMAALNAVMAANPWILAATAIAAVTAAIVVYTATAEDGAQAAKDFRDELDATAEAHTDTIAAIDEQKKSTSAMVDKVLELASAENLSVGEKAAMLSMIDDLNAAVPELNLSYNELTGTLTLTAEKIREVAFAEAERAKYEQNVKRLKEAYIEQAAAADGLKAAQERLTTAAENYDPAATLAGLASQGLAIATADAGKEFRDAQVEVEIYTNKSAELEGEIGSLEAAINGYAETTVAATGATQGLSQETASAAEAISGSLQTLIESYGAAYSAAYENIEGTISGFGEMAATVPTHIQTINDALDSQISFIDTYMDNLAKAAEMGISDGLLAQLSDGSVESANILAGIVEDGGAKVQELNDKFQQVQEGKEAFAAQVAEMQTDFAEASGEIVSAAQTMVNDLNQKMAASTSGAETIQGYIDGLNSKLGELAGIAAKINGYTAKGGKADGSHAFGLDYVPYDDYNATLHKGEAVLTALEAKAWRAEQVANYSYPDNRVTNVTQHNYFTVPSKAVYDEIADEVNRRLGGEMP